MKEPGDEVLFELRRVGNVVKASAIHVGTNVEVAVVGPARASEYSLKMAALRKLRYVLARQAKAQQD